jgi:hypothetical protein
MKERESRVGFNSDCQGEEEGHSFQLSKDHDLYGVDGQEFRIVYWCSFSNLY